MKVLKSFSWTKTELLLANIFKILCQQNWVSREQIDEILSNIFEEELVDEDE